MTTQAIVSIVSSISLTIFTLALVIYTAFLWIETKRSRIQNITPQISIIIYPISPVYIGIKFENTSLVDAKNIEILCLNNNIYNDNKGKIFKYSDKLSRRFSYMAAKQCYSFTFGYYSIMKNEIFEFKISFNDISCKNKLKRHVYIDMSDIESVLFERLATKEIAHSLEKLVKTISPIIDESNGKGLRVHTYPPEYREIKRLKYEQLLHKWQNENE